MRTEKSVSIISTRPVAFEDSAEFRCEKLCDIVSQPIEKKDTILVYSQIFVGAMLLATFHQQWNA